eukprot:TRINITY_DN14794_c0_g1_i2.p1 TRINITY_DN14794_c0_g1~~TRINITY_DN14794_c0_g1_i2.p1  ORF type:complete len:695 (+),score=246.16 TRINITY_DN14794_c0_g1_i2:54-2138(+)
MLSHNSSAQRASRHGPLPSSRAATEPQVPVQPAPSAPILGSPKSAAPPPSLVQLRPAAAAPSLPSPPRRGYGGAQRRPQQSPLETSTGRARLAQSLERLLRTRERSQQQRPHDDAAQRVFSHFFAVRPAADGTAQVFLSYPVPVQEFLLVHHQVAQFCYPEEPDSADRSAPARFGFTLTDASGGWQHGFVLRTVSGLCYGLISKQPWFRLFDEVLAHAARQHSEGGQPAAVYELYRTPVPCPGATVVATPAMPVKFEARRCADHARYPLSEAGITELLTALRVDGAMRLLAHALDERRVLFLHDDLGRLSACCYALAALLTPMSWPHTFVPTLPTGMLDAVCAPTPFIIGVHSSSSSRLQRLPMDECVVVDLRSGTVADGDDADALQLPDAGRLREAISVAIRADSRGRPTRRAHSEVLDCVTRWFAGIVAPVLLYSVRVMDERGREVSVCDWGGFEAAVQPKHRRFVGRLRQTATFLLWAQKGARGPGNDDVFARLAAQALPGQAGGVIARLTGKLPGVIRGKVAQALVRHGRLLPQPQQRRLPVSADDRRGDDEPQLQLGQKAAVRSEDGKTRGCTVVAVRADRVKVHFDGLPESKDEWVAAGSGRVTAVMSPSGSSSPRARCSLDRTHAFVVGSKVAARREGRWRGGTVIDVTADAVCVHYDGCDYQPEWIPADDEHRLASVIASFPSGVA